MTDIRIGIVSWNTAAELDRCLAALPAAVGDLQAEVVVIDNASRDSSVEVAKAHDSVVVVVNDQNVGYARAMNQALCGSSAPVLVALNPDTQPPPGSLVALARDLNRWPTAAVVVPRLVREDGSLEQSVASFPTIASATARLFWPPRRRIGRLGRRWWVRRAPLDQSGPVDYACGAVHVIRAAALRGRRPYLERWFMYAEDGELCWRLHRDGWDVMLDADVTVLHTGNASGAKAWSDSTRMCRMRRAEYDMWGLCRGRWWVRRWAAVNILSAATNAAAHALLSFTSPGRRAAHLVSARRWVNALSLDVQVMVHGPPPPDRSAPD